MILKLKRVASPLLRILGGGKLGRGLHREHPGGDRLAAGGVEMTGKLVDLRLVEIGERRHRAADIAVERAVALGDLGLVAVVGKHDAASIDGAELRSEPRQEPTAAVAGLDVFINEARHRRTGERLDLPARHVDRLFDRRHEEANTEALSQLGGEATSRGGIVAAGHRNADDVIGPESLHAQRRHDA